MPKTTSREDSSSERAIKAFGLSPKREAKLRRRTTEIVACYPHLQVKRTYKKAGA